MTNREYMESLDDREFARILAAVAGHEGNKEEVDFWEFWLQKEKVKGEVEALEQEPKWIPVSERLPEEGELVLTQAIFKDDVKLAVSSRVDYNYWTGWGTRDINIVAWMPLPQPYRAESEDKE